MSLEFMSEIVSGGTPLAEPVQVVFLKKLMWLHARSLATSAEHTFLDAVKETSVAVKWRRRPYSRSSSVAMRSRVSVLVVRDICPSALGSANQSFQEEGRKGEGPWAGCLDTLLSLSPPLNTSQGFLLPP